MKELSIEEKAYNNLIERLKDFQFEYRFSPFSDTIERYFPELKESEGEKIRKALIAYHSSTGSIHALDKFTSKQICDWLEKQGEKKLVDKAEPKFNAEDWVVTSYGKVNQVVSVDKDDDGYTLDDGTYFSGSWRDMYHLWTIQDAKDGDVLTTKDAVFIFKHIDKTGLSLCKSYCEVIGNSELGLGFDFSINGVYPATKERRELLFSKMKEAGYEWDADKKELNKIDYLNQQEAMGIAVAKCFEWNEQKSTDNVEQKFNECEWSEEDENKINSIKYLLHELDNYNFDNWFKSIKDRVHLQNTYYNNDIINIEVWITKNKQWILKLNGKVVRGQWGDEPQCIYKQYFNLNEIISTYNKKNNVKR